MKRIVLLVVVLLIASAPVHADDLPLDREGLWKELCIARIRADTDQRRVAHLLQLADELVKRLAESRTTETASTTAEALRLQVECLQEQIQGLELALREEQKRHVRNVEALEAKAASANTERDELRLLFARAKDAVTVAQLDARLHKDELDRVRWVHAKRLPRDGVAKTFAYVPADHWRKELASGDRVRARVALGVLAVIPDPSPAGVEAILRAVGSQNSLLDAAIRPLVRIGEPAVQPLVEVGCGEGTDVVIDRGWILHVLGEIGPAARDALPWLEELAEGKSRKADQARRAIERIKAGG